MMFKKFSPTVILFSFLSTYSFEPFELNLMTFNIVWGLEPAGYADLIKRYSPDLVGLQESNNQVNYIKNNLPEYELFFYGPNDSKGNNTTMLYKKSVWELDSSDIGKFMLSDTPDDFTRVGGDADYRHMQWIRLTHKSSGEAFYHFNSHYHWNGSGTDERRLNNSKLLVSRILDRKDTMATVIFTCDCNAGWYDESTEYLTNRYSETNPFPMVSAYKEKFPNDSMGLRTAHRWQGIIGGVPSDDWTTTNGFTYYPDTGQIDYVFINSKMPFKVLDAQIIRDTIPGGVNRVEYKYPSDHYPVMARVEFSPFVGIVNHSKDVNDMVENGLVLPSEVQIQWPNSKLTVHVYDLTGKQIWTSRRTSEKELFIPIPSSLNGQLLYFVFEH